MLGGLDPTDPTFGPALQKLGDICMSLERIPSSDALSVDRLNIDENITSGVFSDVFRGTYGGREVRVKRRRVSPADTPGGVTKGHIYYGHRQSFAVF